jgi:hypothetical protein
MRVLRENLAHELDGRIEETIPYGERIVVAFRPSEAWHSDRPLDDGIAYVVVTVHDGAITEMKGCATRASAEDYAMTGRIWAPRVNRVRPPDVVTSPPRQRVSGLIPFVHVTDVERSIAWYGHLGFVVTEIFTPGGRLNWADLASGDGAHAATRLQPCARPRRHRPLAVLRTTLRPCGTSSWPPASAPGTGGSDIRPCRFSAAQS